MIKCCRGATSYKEKKRFTDKSKMKMLSLLYESSGKIKHTRRSARNKLFMCSSDAYSGQNIQLEDGDECQETAAAIEFDEFIKYA